MTTAQMDWSAIFDRAATGAAFRDTARSSQAARTETADTRQRFSLDDVVAGSTTAKPAPEAPRSRQDGRDARVKDSRSDARVESRAEPKAAQRPSSENKLAPADRTSKTETTSKTDSAAPAKQTSSSPEASAPRPEPSVPKTAAVEAADVPRQPDQAEAVAGQADESEASASTETVEARSDTEEAASAGTTAVDPTVPNAEPIPVPQTNSLPPLEASLMVAAAAKPPEPVAGGSATAPEDEADVQAPAAGALQPRAELLQATAAVTGQRAGAVGTDFKPPASDGSLPGAGPVSGDKSSVAATSVESTASTASAPSTESAPSTAKAVEFAQLLGTSSGNEVVPPAPTPAAGGPTPAAAAPDALGALPPAGSVGAATGTAPSSAAAATATTAPTEASSPPVPLGAVPMAIALRALQDTHRFEIRLDPADLGRIDVRLDIDRQDGTVRTDLVVDRPATLALLQRDAGALQQALSQAGLDASGGINLSLRDGSGDGAAGGQGQGQNAGGDPARGRPGTPSRTSRMEAVGPAAPVAARALRLSGIDIRI